MKKISPQSFRERKENPDTTPFLLRIRNLRAFAVVLLMLLSACAGKDDVPADKAQKVKKFTPENTVITEEKLDQWLNASERVGEFIRRFALEGEEVKSKEDFMFLAHSSPRTEAVLTSLFKEMDLKQGEFWWILDRLNEAKKYTELKTEEDGQNRRIDVILAAGREERMATEKAIAKTLSEADRKEFARRLDIINAKFSELSSLKGHITPETVGVGASNLELYHNNRDRIDAAMKKMWKINPDRAEIPRDKSIPGH